MVLVTYLSLILGELVPKRVALAHAEALAERIAIPMHWLSKAAFPLVWLLQTSTDAVAKALPGTKAPQGSVTEDDVRALIAAAAREGVFHRHEKEMIDRVLRLADRSVESIMVPRGDIIWLDSRAALDEIWNEARNSGHSRFLICDGDLEQLIGVITLGDLGDALRLGAIEIDKHVRPPLHVPTTVSALRLLELFRDSNVHVAVVTGEYGEVLGLVTPSDLLKAIAGDLGDVGSRERAEAVRREDGAWLMDGHIQIHEAERLLERTDLARGESYHTVAGFVLWHLGRLPLAGESLSWRDLRFEVVDMDGPRIDKLLVSTRGPATHSTQPS